jgi:nucleoside-diphosphate-sugar epimerase
LNIIRPCVVFGESNRGNVYTLARQIQTGRFLPVGSLSNKKSMAYVGNITEFMRTLIENQADSLIPSPINYADKPDLTTNELVTFLYHALRKKNPPKLRVPYWMAMAGGKILDATGRLIGRTFPISAIRIAKFTAGTTISTQQLDDTGFTRPFTLTEGLQKTVEADFLKHS